jgi:hypothetical protein
VQKKFTFTFSKYKDGDQVNGHVKPTESENISLETSEKGIDENIILKYFQTVIDSSGEHLTHSAMITLVP